MAGKVPRIKLFRKFAAMASCKWRAKISPLHIDSAVSHNNRETIKQIEEIKLTLYKFKKYDYVL